MKNKPDEGVDFGDVDVVQLLDGGLDLVLVGLDVDEEDQGVVVFDLLHRRFGCQRVLDDVVGIHPKYNDKFVYSKANFLLIIKWPSSYQ